MERATVRELADSLLAGANVSIVSTDQIQTVHDILQQDLLSYVKSGEYMQAQKVEDICTLLLQQKAEVGYNSVKGTRFENLNSRVKLAQRDLEEAKRNVEDLRKNFELERDNAVSILEAEHDTELEKWEQENCTEMPQSFKKFSKEYLNLRRQEEHLVQSKRFADASKLREAADALEQQELKIHEEKWIKSVTQQRDTLIQRQNQQKAVLIKKFEKKWAVIYPPAIKEVDRAEKALKAAEAKLSEAQLLSPGKGRVRPPMRTGQRMTNRNVSMRIIDYTSRLSKPKRQERRSASVL